MHNRKEELSIENFLIIFSAHCAPQWAAPPAGTQHFFVVIDEPELHLNVSSPFDLHLIVNILEAE